MITKTDSVPELQCRGVNKVKTAMDFHFNQEDGLYLPCFFFFLVVGGGDGLIFAGVYVQHLWYNNCV